MGTLLAVDLGGTKCAVGLFELDGTTFEPLVQTNYTSADYQDIDEIIVRFLDKGGLHPDYACLGIAGVVEGKTARMTNLSWKMAEDALKEKFSLADVRLINDMTALCSAIPAIESDDMVALQRGVPDPHGVIGVIAPGTGLGEGYLCEGDTQFFPQGTEGGHARFSPANDDQIALLLWLRETHDVVSAEMVCAGPAIFKLYEFLKTQGEKETDHVKEELLESATKTAVIVKNALGDDACPLCIRTVELFLSLLGTEAANLALKLYATKGIYIGGGIIPRLVGKYPLTSFLQAFRQVGTMQTFIERVPVIIIMNHHTVLHGAVRYGRKIFGS